MNNLIEKYNYQNSVLVVSSYPEKGVKYSAKVCAVGGYVKNTVASLSDFFKKTGVDRKFVVLTIKTGKEEMYTENGVLVWRIFERNRPISYLRIIKAIWQFSNIKDVLVEFEFASFGGSKTTSLLPLLLVLLKLVGKKTVLVIHQVVTDLSLLSPHLGWKKSFLKVSIYNKVLQLFLFISLFSVNKAVVLEEILQRRLGSLAGFAEKISVIPHGIDRGLKLRSREISRNKLKIQKGEFVLLYFGYLTWYKGVDFLIQTFSEHKEIGGIKIRLIIAGGESVTQKSKAHYRKFIKRIYNLAKDASNITITGFVSEKDIPLYFAASDLAVLPYRVFMSSSGPLSFASSFGKPFIISSALEDYFSSADFRNACVEAGLNKEDIIFNLESSTLVEKIKYLMIGNRLAPLAKFSQILSRKRDFNTLAPHYAHLISQEYEQEFLPVFPRLLAKGAA